MLTIAGAVFAIVVRLALPRLLARRGVWFRWHTRFGPALVFDSEDEDGTTVRLLNVNGTYQSVCYVDDDLLWVPVCEYHRTWAKAVRRRFGPPSDAPSHGDRITRRALVMGGGGYSFPKWLVAYRPDFSCEAVEIDPAIEQIAREQFFVDRLVDGFDTEHSGRLVLTIADAWGDEETCFAQSFTISQGNDKFTVDISDANMGISHLYAIMTEDSASASESLIVGLLPYMDVKIFGQQSHGKFCSGIMYSAKDWYKDYDDVLKDEQRELGNQYAGKWGIYVMIGRYADKYGNTPCMPDGFKPDFEVEDRPVEPYQLGNESEAMLAAVLARLRGSETTPHGARAAGVPAHALGAEIPRDRGPAYGTRILLQQQKPL